MKYLLIFTLSLLSACATTQEIKSSTEAIEVCKKDMNHPECQKVVKYCEANPDEQACSVLTGNVSSPAQRIELPKVPKEDVMRSPFINTQKTIVVGPQGIKYEFYYGSGGQYLILVVPPNGSFIDFSQAEATLVVDPKGKNPETLSLAVEKNGLLTGNGQSRNFKVDFILHLLVPANKYHQSLENSLSFKVKIKDFAESLN